MMMKCFARGATQVTSDVQAKKEKQDQKNQKNKKRCLKHRFTFSEKRVSSREFNQELIKLLTNHYFVLSLPYSIRSTSSINGLRPPLGLLGHVLGTCQSSL